MKKTLSITVQNEAGVLTRISTIFSSRSFNVESITVGTTENERISKIILVIPGDSQIVEQITKQLNKLVQVIEVKDLSTLACVERELILIKIQASGRARSEALEIAKIFFAKTVDISTNSITFELCGNPKKISAIHELLKHYKILEIVRTGKIAIEREFIKK